MGTSPKIVNNSAVTLVPVPTSSSPARLEFSEGRDWFPLTFAPPTHSTVPHTRWYLRNICGPNEWMELVLCLTPHNLSSPPPPWHKATAKGSRNWCSEVVPGPRATLGEEALLWRDAWAVCSLSGAPQGQKSGKGFIHIWNRECCVVFPLSMGRLGWICNDEGSFSAASLVKGGEPRTAPAVSWSLSRLPHGVPGVIVFSFSPTTPDHRGRPWARAPWIAAGTLTHAQGSRSSSRSASALEGRRSPQATRGPAGALREWFPWFSTVKPVLESSQRRLPAPGSARLPRPSAGQHVDSLPRLRRASVAGPHTRRPTACRPFPHWTGYPFLALHVVFRWEHFQAARLSPGAAKSVWACVRSRLGWSPWQPVRSVGMGAVAVTCVPRPRRSAWRVGNSGLHWLIYDWY